MTDERVSSTSLCWEFFLRDCCIFIVACGYFYFGQFLQIEMYVILCDRPCSLVGMPPIANLNLLASALYLHFRLSV